MHVYWNFYCSPAKKYGSDPPLFWAGDATDVWYLSPRFGFPAFNNRLKIKHHLLFFFECMPRYIDTIHWHHALWCHPFDRCYSGQMHPHPAAYSWCVPAEPSRMIHAIEFLLWRTSFPCRYRQKAGEKPASPARGSRQRLHACKSRLRRQHLHAG